MSFNVLSAQEKHFTPEQLISQVEHLFRESAETLNYNKVVELSNKIILQRKNYPNEIIAKTYMLLARVASNKGELETAFQFIQDGLAIPIQHLETKLCLQIKLASILSAKKQYQPLLTSAQQTIDILQDQKNSKYFLFALSYRSVAFAMLNQHEKALSDLQKIESFIKRNPSFAEHVTLLATLANAYYYLGDYQTVLTVQLKILKLRFNLNKLNNVDQTYYHLANAYYRLNRFNDAYNAYWEAKNYAEKKAALIYVAYANQGLGETLIKQKHYNEAETRILTAKELFYKNNLARPYLETIISLAQIKSFIGQKNKATSLLVEAEKLLTATALTDDYIVFYRLLAEMYQIKKEFSKAYFWLQKYNQALLNTTKPVTIASQTILEKITNNGDLVNNFASGQARQLTVKLAEKSALETSFFYKYQQQQKFIILLSSLSLLLLSSLIFLWIKKRTKKLKNTYEALEKPNNVVATPIQTKQLYQHDFNMARKYSYPLTVGYISISNWSELTFQFNKKIVAEVAREIASLMNKHTNEFESVGLINKGEYLLLFPHQNKADAEHTMNKLISALKLRFFANLGEFSVTIAYSLETPNFQDIDPYIFLSQLSDSTKIA
ncbi:MAG: hypothetical protein COB83_01365 [Gammaproteobacteria bacterium]|nr:MAG: hypothetical protein COB83_01365 [Gammaproteobacteria bacterium]